MRRKLTAKITKTGHISLRKNLGVLEAWAQRRNIRLGKRGLESV